MIAIVADGCRRPRGVMQEPWTEGGMAVTVRIPGLSADVLLPTQRDFRPPLHELNTLVIPHF